MSRPTLTKAQQQTETGLELLSLCKTMTADGRILDEEILGLKKWLDENRNSELSAIHYLVSIIDTVVADGKITPEERKTVHLAVEKILPPDLRIIAQMHKRQANADEKEIKKQSKQAEKQRLWEEERRNEPSDEANFMIAGTRYEGREAVIKKHIKVGDSVLFKREPFNKFSPNAIGVFTKNNEMMIGYVPEDDAEEMAEWLDRGDKYKAIVTKILGYKSIIPVIDASFYNSDKHNVSTLDDPLPISQFDDRAIKKKPSFLRKMVLISVCIFILYQILN